MKAIVQVGAGWKPEDLPGDDPRRYFADAESTVRRMEALVVTLLALIQHEPGEIEVKRERIDLVRVIHKVMGSQQAEPGGRIFHLRGPEELAVMADPGLLHGLLGNLYANSREYSPAGSEIHCALEVVGGQAGIRLLNVCENLSDDDIERLWEPFWRGGDSGTDSTHQGLGMSLVKAYAECMGWQVVASLPQADRFRVVVSGIDISQGCYQFRSELG